MALQGKSITRLSDLELDDIQELMSFARQLRAGEVMSNIGGRSILGLFLAPSLRTRVSFERAVMAAGGQLTALGQQEVWAMTPEEGIPMYGNAVEHVKDAAKSLSHYVDLMAIRHDPKLDDFALVQEDALIQSFRKYSQAPVLNLGSGMYRPIQALADLLAVDDHFRGLAGRKLVVTWTYHPQPLAMGPAHSMIELACRFGMHVYVTHPEHYALHAPILQQAEQAATAANGSLSITKNPVDAFSGADVVFACSWGAKEYYGNWDQEKLLREKLKDWSVDGRKMRMTNDARFLFPLPIRRNIAADDEVIDAHYSLVYEQAANLPAVQQAILTRILCDYQGS